MKDLGQKIKIIRELKNFTQEYMAENLGMKQSTYCNLEHKGDKILYDKIEMIAGLFDMKPENIFNFDTKAVLLFINNNCRQHDSVNAIMMGIENHNGQMKRINSIGEY